MFIVQKSLGCSQDLESFQNMQMHWTVEMSMTETGHKLTGRQWHLAGAHPYIGAKITHDSVGVSSLIKDYNVYNWTSVTSNDVQRSTTQSVSSEYTNRVLGTIPNTRHQKTYKCTELDLSIKPKFDHCLTLSLTRAYWVGTWDTIVWDLCNVLVPKPKLWLCKWRHNMLLFMSTILIKSKSKKIGKG